MSRAAFAAAALTAAATAVVVAAAPASAVQTDVFSLSAEGDRAGIVYSAGGGPVRDAVRVGNRTDQPITVALESVEVTEAEDGTLSYGRSGEGLAASVDLASPSVTLGPYEEKLVAVAIAPSPEGRLAAVTGIVEASEGDGLAVRSRLAVIIKQEGAVPMTALYVAALLAGVLIVSASVLIRRARGSSAA